MVLCKVNTPYFLFLCADRNVRQNQPVQLLPVLEAAHPIAGPVRAGRPWHFYAQVQGSKVNQELSKTSRTGGGRRFGVVEVLHFQLLERAHR